MNKIHDYCLEKKLNFILDGTFVYGKYLENIARSLKRERRVTIFYLYQEPLVAWNFVQKRERLEGRNISKEAFIYSFFQSRYNVEDVKRQFNNKVELNLVKKDFEHKLDKIEFNIPRIDPYLKVKYNEADLWEKL